MSKITPFSDPNLLFGFSAGDDTGVYKINENTAIVQSVDFFTPLVDDPYMFGQISAANAMSDIYTVGAKPLTALNILCFPCKLGMEIASEIMRGGADKVKESGAVLLGGHSVEDDEPKYGLSVTGVVHPDKMIMNKGAAPGDRLVLTKKIGTGILINIRKLKDSPLRMVKPAGRNIPEKVYDEAACSMMRLNKTASEIMVEFGVHACTDVTGFGLLGHAGTMAQASGVSFVIDYSSVPLFEGIEPFAISGTKGGGERNYSWIKNRLTSAKGVTLEQTMILCDAQTSGGLLMAVEDGKAEKLVQRLRESGDEAACVIGHVERGKGGTLSVKL